VQLKVFVYNILVNILHHCFEEISVDNVQEKIFLIQNLRTLVEKILQDLKAFRNNVWSVL